jgi:choline kinase
MRVDEVCLFQLENKFLDNSLEISCSQTKKMENKGPSKAIVIAAGMGKRLRPFTDDVRTLKRNKHFATVIQRPKCMVSIANQPMLYRTVKCLRNVGVKEIVIIIGYKSSYFEKIKDELGEVGLQ